MNDRYLDVDFTKEKQYVFGALPKKKLFGAPRYEDKVPTIDEGDWRRLSEEMDASNDSVEFLITRILGQLQEGSCVANASTQANEITQCKQVGAENVVHLSAISLYKRIGSSAQSGANVEDAIHEMVSGGILPLDTPENRAKFGNCVMPNTGFRTPYPSGYQEVMKQFAALEWNEVTSVAGLMTAGFRREPIVVGRAGHSICYCRPQWSNNKWVWKYVNSWDEEDSHWGDAGGNFAYGFGYDSQRLFNESAMWAYVLRSVVVGD